MNSKQRIKVKIEQSHLVLQVVGQVDVLRGVWIIQQLSVTWIHQVDAELHDLLHRTLWDHVRKLRVLQENKQGSESRRHRREPGNSFHTSSLQRNTLCVY